MSSFITVDEFKAYPLPITAAQWQKVGDDQLALVIENASEHLEDYMDRKINIARYVERKRGSNQFKQLLENWPVTEVHAVTSYAVNGTPTGHNVGLFTTAESGIVEWLDRTRYKFGRDLTWIFDYSAGYSEVPKPIKHATYLQTLKMLQPIFRGGAQFTEVELVSELDEQVAELCERYRRARFS